ncbi:hypothetical protein EC957_010258 [Mortierella hygrophila]|uniref:DNA-directed primase/polymerase protein n=1 Tax=Mortierella hygrophila TaxID=979708 RepID=A0A9P6JXE3_9FUNG|nr:hypothetical protein EC957_010258 [Mortierella hygrophila]
MNHKFESTYFKTDKTTQAQGPQARSYEWGDKNSHQFFVAFDTGPAYFEYSSYKDPARFLEAYASVPDADRCFFEQIREGHACNEYYDIEWTLGQVADKSDILRLEQQMFTAFLNARNQYAPDYPLDTAHCRVLSASKNKKISLHIIIPTYMFENNNRHMKAFVLSFKDTWSSASDEDSALLDHIDTTVYTMNRVMRILGSCKFKDLDRPLMRAQWHEPSMVAEDKEFLITNIGPDSVQPLVDTVKAKFMQTPQATQFEMHCKTARCSSGWNARQRDTIISQTPHEPLHADTVYNARYVKHLMLGRGRFDTAKQPSLIIRCDTGGGKTRYTEALVKANNGCKFVAVSCRRTQGSTQQARLENFNSYQDVPGVIACNKIAIQAESLYRLDMKFYAENTIVILDELSSLIKQMCSDKTMGNKHGLNLLFFEMLIRTASRVICLDADVTDAEVDIMKSLRSDFHVTNNTFQQQKDDTVVLFDSLDMLVIKVQELLKDRKRIWISTTMSAERAEALHNTLTAAGRNGMCITKDTQECEKQDASKNINDIMTDLDYFIHTPTISVGVDYNIIDHVDYVVGIFSTHSEVDVETCIQMMRRVRHNKEKTYLIHADATTNKKLPATAQEVKGWLCNQLKHITGEIKGTPLLRLIFNDEKELKVPDYLYHRMYCHVTAMKNLSINNFRLRLIEKMTRAGCVVIGEEGRPPKNHPVITSLRQEEEAIASAACQQIADADPVDEDEIRTLLERKDCDLSAAQKASIQKYKLMRVFDVKSHNTVTADWVKTYDNKHEKDVYTNLVALSARTGPSLKACLDKVQLDENILLDYSLRDATSAKAHSKLERSQFVKLECAVDILTACGFNATFATNEVSTEDLKERINMIWRDLENKMSHICNGLKKPRPTHNNWTFENKLKFLCTVLNEVLGVKIISANKRRTRYHLKHFSATATAENSPLRAHALL